VVYIVSSIKLKFLTESWVTESFLNTEKIFNLLNRIYLDNKWVPSASVTIGTSVSLCAKKVIKKFKLKSIFSIKPHFLLEKQ